MKKTKGRRFREGDYIKIQMYGDKVTFRIFDIPEDSPFFVTQLREIISFFPKSELENAQIVRKPTAKQQKLALRELKKLCKEQGQVFSDSIFQTEQGRIPPYQLH